MSRVLQSSRTGRITILVLFITAIFYSFLSLRTVHEFAVKPINLTPATHNEIPLTEFANDIVDIDDVDDVTEAIELNGAEAIEVKEVEEIEVKEDDEIVKEAESSQVVEVLIPEVNVVPASTSNQDLKVPVDYLADATIDQCESTYGLSYLENLASTKTSYCEHTISNSSSTFECFRTNISEARRDSFCVAHGAVFNFGKNKFDVDCKLRNWDGADARELSDVPQIHEFPQYMYETGPAYTLPKFLKISQTHSIPGQYQNCSESDGNMVVLVKREGIGNPWHCLNEIFSFYMSMDVLWMASRERSNGNSTDRGLDYSKAQVVITDHESEGPFWDLWGLLSGKPPIRLANFQNSSQAACRQDVLLPLPGGSNPLWHDDWISQACTDSNLLNTFTYRLRGYYNITLPNPSRPITMTIIDRKDSRRIKNFGYHVQRVREGYPNVDVRVVDFAAYTFAEQVEIASETDILVGVHGAGLVHAMFMPKNGAVVEILPKEVDYRVYRNLAKLRGHRYFGTHAIGEIVEDDWHGQDVEIEDEDWVDLIEGAVRSMENRGTLNMDIN